MAIRRVTSPLRGGRIAEQSGWGSVAEVHSDPPPDIFAGAQMSTSPLGGGDNEIVAVARSFIGTPYVHQASVKGVGCDCLGLLRGVWRELKGAEPEVTPPYSPDWAEASGEETLYKALARHLAEIPRREIAPGDVALFRMARTGPAKHCGIVAQSLSGATASLHERRLALIHARQNKRVSEETFSAFWQRRLAYAFRI